MVTDFMYNQNTNILSWLSDTPGEHFNIAYSVGDDQNYSIIYEGIDLSCPFDCTGLGSPIYASNMKRDKRGDLSPHGKKKIVD